MFNCSKHCFYGSWRGATSNLSVKEKEEEEENEQQEDCLNEFLDSFFIVMIRD